MLNIFSAKYRDLTLAIIKIVAVLFFAFSMITFPEVVFKAALRGLETWWKIVFPALLPFFVVSEILMGLGVVHFLGVLLEPVMRPLFNLPGAAAFAVAVGYTSGAPIGATLTGQLRRQKLCTKTEAERLIAFTNNASPLFMFGAVAVGMFNNPGVGSQIAGAHYLANLCLGIAFRFYGFQNRDRGQPPQFHGRLLRNAAKALLQAQIADGRPFGKLLGDAVRNSVQTLLTIGGFIIIFSVVIEVLTVARVINCLAGIFASALGGLKLAPGLYYALASGTVEMTIGAKLASEVEAPLTQQLLIVSAILGWLGLSVHAQAISMIADTDIDIKPYLFARIGHGILAAFWMSLLLRAKFSLAAFAPHLSALTVSPWLFSYHLLQISFKILAVLLILSLAITVLNKLLRLQANTFFHK
ncbi:sporulation integral membrane protein YlbJ [Zhaonella formicivorans]|uniref:sporulation integral membrane protein YlbJ n=1 Tax=Zhaonella formicivorans TaxID=2528593 RepID=UPI0010E16F92|nr:sporulation integral membrane protein YlbJ [Zhaonella formicivorans]